MGSAQEGFAAFREPVDRRVFAPGFVWWTRIGMVLRRALRNVLNLPDRGGDAAPDDIPPGYFRFPRF